MEITNDAPLEYQEFSLRRFFWQSLGLRYDELSHKEVTETLTFMDLEKKHPHRWQKKDD